MSTSNGTSPVPAVHEAPREPTRLVMAPLCGRNHLDAGWWPRSRDLAGELRNLLADLPPESGRVVRALFSPPDWDPAPRKVPIGGGYLKVGSFPRDDTHVMLLTTSDRKVLRVLVVPPSFSQAQGTEALLAASTAGNSYTGAEVLIEVLSHPDVNAVDLWSDDGGR